MKKNKVLLIVMVAVMVISVMLVMTGCSAVGVYKFKSMSQTQGGTEMSFEVGEKYMGMITLTEDFATLELNSDGTAKLTISYGGSQTTKGTWTQNGSTIELTMNGSTTTAQIGFGTITIDNGGGKLVLVKK